MDGDKREGRSRVRSSVCERDRTRGGGKRTWKKNGDGGIKFSLFLKFLKRHWSMTQDKVSFICQKLNCWD